jgi:DNA polymerase-3 subunit alpha
MTLREELEQWLLTNKLAFEFKDEWVFTIEGAGTFLLIEGQETIVDKDFNLAFSDIDEARKNATRGEIEAFVYKFGTRFYYTDGTAATLVELRYVGKEKDCFDTFPLLGIHGAYDLCNGSRPYKDWIKKVKFAGVETIAICEENTLAGTLAFQTACEKAGIRSIIGETVTVKDDKGLTYNIKLYVKNEEGWRNLLMINSFINVHNEDKFITERQIMDHFNGLIVVLTPEVKDISQNGLCFHNMEECYYQIDPVQWDSIERDDEWLQSIQNYFSTTYSALKPVLISDAFYLEKEHSAVRKDLNAIGKLPFKNQSSDQYFKTPTELLLQLVELLESDEGATALLESVIENTKRFDQIDFKIPTGYPFLPQYVMTEEEKELYEDGTAMMWSLIAKGFEERIVGKNLKHTEDEYLQRIEEEMEVICGANLEDYFLITWDILNWCKSQNIMTGFGRGSVSGSLVAYLLKIAHADPLQYGLLFSRFLNSARLLKQKKELATIVTLDDGSEQILPESYFTKLSKGDVWDLDEVVKEAKFVK